MVTGTAVAPRKEPLTFQGLLDRMRPEMEGLLPKHLTAERMMTLVQLAATKTPRLKECTPVSLFTAVMHASRLGLEIGTHAHLVPFKNKSGGMECVMIPDYRGLVHLAVSSGKVKHIDVRVAYNDDLFEYELGTTPFIKHRPKLGAGRKNSDLLCVYTVGWLADGTPVIGEPMTMAEIDAVRARSRAKDDGPWVSDYIQMGKKTVLKRDLKMYPQTPELTAAIELDNRAESGTIGTVSDLIDTAAEVAHHVSEKTSEKTAAIKEKVAAGQKKRADAKAEALAEVPPPADEDGVVDNPTDDPMERVRQAALKADRDMLEAERAAQRDK